MLGGSIIALNATDGTLNLARNAAEYPGIEIPVWGICGSPVVAGNTVIVSLAGTLAAYGLETGKIPFNTVSEKS